MLASPSSGSVNQPTSLNLSWGAVTGAASYSILVSASSSFGTTVSSQTGITGLTAAVGGLANSTSYYWEVNATNIGGTSAWSGAWSFTTVIPAPAAPLLTLPTNNAIGQAISLTLTWGTVITASSYELQISIASDFTSTIIDQSGLSAASQLISGLSNSGLYYWRVNAANIGGNGLWSAAWNFTTLAQMQIPLIAAWNMISFNIVPVSDTTVAVFGTDPLGFLFVKDNAGDVYCPLINEDDVHYALVGQGYQVYTTVPDTLTVQGNPVNFANTPITLTSGWNLIAYLPPTDDSAWHAITPIDSSVIIVKNNSGHVYWPSLAIDDIGVMAVGQGYKVLMSAGASFTYPTPLSGVAKRTTIAGHGPMLLHLPDPRHYASHANTGNNATLLAKNVSIENQIAKDSSEIAAYDPAGNLVGSGVVIHGHAAFAIWGADPIAKKKDGCTPGAMITFKLWDGTREYSLDYTPANGTKPKYAVDGVYLGSLSVPSGYFIKRFDLTNAYPNPFKGFIRISFDIPSLEGMNSQDIELNVYDMKGSLVHQIAKGAYQPGHYTVTWAATESRVASLGSSIYIVRMKAKDFDKRIKLIRVQ